MAKIFIEGLSPQEAAACVESYLMGQLPQKGVIVVRGPFMYLTNESVPREKGIVLPVENGPVSEIHSLLPSPFKALSAYREYMDSRRLPVGAAVEASPEGIWVLPDHQVSLGEALPRFRYPLNSLNRVLTAQEAASVFHVDVKQVQGDCEQRGRGVLRRNEARKSGNVWLLTLEAADRVYGVGRETKDEINPLLLVYSTVEAAALWGRTSGDVRSAASGAGHRAARMWDGDRRKSGRTWLVTREAMERVFGPSRAGALLSVAKDL